MSAATPEPRAAHVVQTVVADAPQHSTTLGFPPRGEVAERLKAAVSKTVVGDTPQPRVRIPPSPPLLFSRDGHSGSSSQPPLRILGYTEGVRRVLHTNRANARSAPSSRAALALSSIDEGAVKPNYLSASSSSTSALRPSRSGTRPGGSSATTARSQSASPSRSISSGRSSSDRFPSRATTTVPRSAS